MPLNLSIAEALCMLIACLEIKWGGSRTIGAILSREWPRCRFRVESHAIVASVDRLTEVSLLNLQPAVAISRVLP